MCVLAGCSVYAVTGIHAAHAVCTVCALKVTEAVRAVFAVCAVCNTRSISVYAVQIIHAGCRLRALFLAYAYIQ